MTVLDKHDEKEYIRFGSSFSIKGSQNCKGVVNPWPETPVNVITKKPVPAKRIPGKASQTEETTQSEVKGTEKSNVSVVPTSDDSDDSSIDLRVIGGMPWDDFVFPLPWDDFVFPFACEESDQSIGENVLTDETERVKQRRKRTRWEQ